MCVSKGAPKKPSYGPCNERHMWSWQPIYTYVPWSFYNGTTFNSTYSMPTTAGNPTRARMV